jgi:predicted kinase
VAALRRRGGAGARPAHGPRTDATAPAAALLLLTVGLSGSGKSTVALELLQALGAVRLLLDVERKRLAGLAATARPSAQQTAQLYGPAMTQRTCAPECARRHAAGGRAERDRRRRRAAPRARRCARWPRNAAPTSA